MSTRPLALLFIALFIIGAFLIIFVQPFGSASAGITSGFMMPFDNMGQVAVLMAAGLASAWASKEAVLAFPLGVLLMLAIGALTQIPMQEYPAVRYFMLGAILLFSLSLSILRSRSFLLWVLPVAVWAYFSGSAAMRHIPPITTPLFFMMGVIVSCALILAIGVALGVTLMDNARASMERLKKSSSALATFLSLF